LPHGKIVVVVVICRDKRKLHIKKSFDCKLFP
jgi:hypothetical protein